MPVVLRRGANHVQREYSATRFVQTYLWLFIKGSGVGKSVYVAPNFFAQLCVSAPQDPPGGHAPLSSSPNCESTETPTASKAIDIRTFFYLI